MIEQRSEAWFQQRIGRVTGSRVGAILGVNPWQSRDDILRAMVREYHSAPSEFEGNIATEWGVNNEDGAIWEFELETGLSHEKCGFFPFEDWLGASPDGLIGEDAILEVKCPYGKKDSSDFKIPEEQPHYLAQMQIEMYCTGRSKAYFWQWSPVGFRKDVIERDDFWLAWALPELKAFHALYLSELDNKEHLEPKRPEIYNQKASALLSEYDDLCDALERAEERKKEVLAELVDMALERDVKICGRNLTRVTRSGSVSYAKAIKELAPDADLSKWTGKPTSYWKLS
ncbi:YqaJ-like viral recombinase domain protein [compost metagenome]